MGLKKRLIKFISKYIILGSTLENSISNIVLRIRSKEVPDDKEIGNLLGAIIRRITRTWSLGLAITLLPTIITIYVLVRQNSILERQNSILEQQTEFFESYYSAEELIENAKILSETGSFKFSRIIALDDIISALKKKYSHIEDYRVPLENIYLTNLNLRSVDFRNLDMDGSILANCEIDNTLIDNCSFKKANFTRADLSKSHFINCNMEKAKFCDYTADSKFLNDNNKIGYAFSIFDTYYKKQNSILFENCNLNGIRITFCDFRNSQFQNCTWDTTEISKELIYGAILIGAKGLSKDQTDFLSKNKAITNFSDLKILISELEEIVSRTNDESEKLKIIKSLDIYRSLYKNKK